jgi:hypothetical protein
MQVKANDINGFVIALLLSFLLVFRAVPVSRGVLLPFWYRQVGTSFLAPIISSCRQDTSHSLYFRLRLRKHSSSIGTINHVKRGWQSSKFRSESLRMVQG